MRIGELGGTYVEAGRRTRVFFAGGSIAAGRVVVVEEAWYLSGFDFVFSEVLDALEMESRILWNLRFVVLIAVPADILGNQI